jgi:hypothetical protein
MICSGIFGESAPNLLDGGSGIPANLDGSGYPDALKGPEISDQVRLSTISDILTALIESRL